MRTDKSTSPFEYVGDWDTYEEGDYALLEVGDQVVVRMHSYSRNGDKLYPGVVTKVTKRQITVRLEIGALGTMRFSRSHGKKIGDNDWHPTRIARNWTGTGRSSFMTWKEAIEAEATAIAEDKRINALRQLGKRVDETLRRFSISIEQINEMNEMLDRWEAEKK